MTWILVLLVAALTLFQGGSLSSLLELFTKGGTGA